MTSYLKRAKFFLGLGVVFGAVSIACSVATVVQFVRGFFDHGQWLYMIGWIFGAGISKSVAFDYRDTSRRNIVDGVNEDGTLDEICDQVTAENPRQPDESIEDYQARLNPLIDRRIDQFVQSQ